MKKRNLSAALNLRSVCAGTLIIAPAVCLGVLAMMKSGVSSSLCVQQLGAMLAFPLLAWALYRPAQRIQAAWLAVLFVFLINATLMHQGVNGVRRWIDLGIFNAHAAMLALPALLVLAERIGNPWPFIIAAGVMLCMQPDFSQLTALALCVLLMICLRKPGKSWRLWSVLAMAACLFRCALAPAALEFVPHCEGILTMLGCVSPEYRVLGWLSLALIPICLLCEYRLYRRKAFLYLAAYYAVLMLFIPSGQYPVPFMGFGLSPIAGYWFARMCVRA